MASVKDDHYPVCRYISGRIVGFQPDTDVRKLVSSWNRIRKRISDLKRFIRYFKDSNYETSFWSLLTFWRKLNIAQSFIYYLRKHLQFFVPCLRANYALKTHFWIVLGYE